MENLEKQFEQELSASRMQIELLRNQVLLQYYTQLLELDPLLQTQEVKALMSCINTLERYARKYDSKKKHNDTTQDSSATQQSARSDNENIDSIPDNDPKQDPCNLTTVNPLAIVKETSTYQIPLVRPVKNQFPKTIKATTPGHPKGKIKPRSETGPNCFEPFSKSIFQNLQPNSNKKVSRKSIPHAILIRGNTHFLLE